MGVGLAADSENQDIINMNHLISEKNEEKFSVFIICLVVLYSSYEIVQTFFPLELWTDFCRVIENKFFN
jgi:hypothetical protein